MDTKALRQKILDLAIRGKLVPQDPNDEPASVLLERIRAEKQQMVKDGKLKAKDIKNDTVIFKGDDNLHYEQFADGSVKCIEDEIPFELPEGWAWCRIRNIANVKGGKRLPKGESFSDDVTDHVYIRVTDMKNRTINTSGLKYITEEVFAKIQSYTISKNDLYVTIAGTIGVVGEVPEILDGMNLTENAVKVCNISINKTFLCYVMLSELVQQQFQDKTHQVAMPKLALERILGTLIPVCPVKEQQLIVFSIKSALQIADTIEIQKNALFELVSATKSKILDLAIRGKLVPQDPNDEPASVLLERIRAEKEELIRQGKIKRDKKESVIFKGDDNSYYEKMSTGEVKCIDDELPFVLPEGWEWARLKSICEPISDGTHQTPKYTDEGYIFLSSKNVTSGYIDWQNVMYISESLHNKLYERIAPQKNDILLAKNGTTGVAALVDKDYIFDIYVTLALIRTIGYQVHPKYILCVFASNTTQYYFKKSLKGIGVPNLHLEQIRETLVPVPPKNEQVKIYEAVENLNRFIEMVEASLN